MVKLIRVTFGIHATRGLLEAVNMIYSRMSDTDRETIDFVIDKNANTAICADVNANDIAPSKVITGQYRFFGNQVLRLLYGYSSITQPEYVAPERLLDSRPEGEKTNRLAKTRCEPFIQRELSTPMVVHSYLPEERVGLTASSRNRDVTSRFPVKSRDIYIDDKTRLPHHS